METLVRRSIWMLLVVPLATVYVMSATVRTGRAQAPEPVREGKCERADELFPNHNPGPGNLEEIAVPEPTELGRYVRNRDVAIALGQALLSDMQVGSDGVQACASCHFRAGADPRSINQLNHGGADNLDPTINLGPNHQLRASEFPLHKVADPTDRHSQVLRDVDDVVSSQGVHLRQFVSAERGAIKDVAVPVADPVFHIDGIKTRRSEPSNTPPQTQRG